MLEINENRVSLRYDFILNFSTIRSYNKLARSKLKGVTVTSA